jgi:hypothetical protein
MVQKKSATRAATTLSEQFNAGRGEARSQARKTAHATKKEALIAGFKSGDPEARRKPWRLWMRGFLRA